MVAVVSRWSHGQLSLIAGFILVLLAASGMPGTSQRANIAHAQEPGLNCDSFTTWEEAQAYYEVDPDGRAYLISDEGGVVCPSLPREQPASPPTSEPNPTPSPMSSPTATAAPTPSPRPTATPRPSPTPRPTPTQTPIDPRVAPYGTAIRALEVSHQGFLNRWDQNRAVNANISEFFRTVRDWQDELVSFRNQAPRPAPCQSSAHQDILSAIREYGSAYESLRDRLIATYEPGNLVTLTQRPLTQSELDRYSERYLSAGRALTRAIARVAVAC